MPAILASWPAVFRPCFTASVWNRILVLIAGAVLAQNKRTVPQVPRDMGLADRRGVGRYHEALNRARWDSRSLAKTIRGDSVPRSLNCGKPGLLPISRSAREIAHQIVHEAGSKAICGMHPFERRLRGVNTVSQPLPGRRIHCEAVGHYRLGGVPDFRWI